MGNIFKNLQISFFDFFENFRTRFSDILDIPGYPLPGRLQSPQIWDFGENPPKSTKIAKVHTQFAILSLI